MAVVDLVTPNVRHATALGSAPRRASRKLENARAAEDTGTRIRIGR